MPACLLADIKCQCAVHMQMDPNGGGTYYGIRFSVYFPCVAETGRCACMHARTRALPVLSLS